jgi:hypothetical protein
VVRLERRLVEQEFDADRLALRRPLGSASFCAGKGLPPAPIQPVS